MIRRLLMMLALILAVTGAFFGPQASAQGEPTCRIVFVEPVTDPPPPVSTTIPVVDAGSDDTTTAIGSVVGSADATAVHTCADAELYPGPFTNMPTTPSSPYAAPVGLSGAIQAVPAAAAAQPAGAGLAHSGTETYILAYLGTGLLAFGAVALGIRRGSASD